MYLRNEIAKFIKNRIVLFIFWGSTKKKILVLSRNRWLYESKLVDSTYIALAKMTKSNIILVSRSTAIPLDYKTNESIKAIELFSFFLSLVKFDPVREMYFIPVRQIWITRVNNSR